MKYILAWFNIIFLICSCKHNANNRLLSVSDDCAQITKEEALNYSDNVSDCKKEDLITEADMIAARDQYIARNYIYRCPKHTCCDTRRECCSLNKCGASPANNPEPVTGSESMIDCGLGEGGFVPTQGGILNNPLKGGKLHTCNRKINIGAIVMDVQYGHLTGGGWEINEIGPGSYQKKVTLIKNDDGEYTFSLTCSIPRYERGRVDIPIEKMTKVYNYKLSRGDIEGFLDERVRKKCLKETWKDLDFVGLSLSIESVRDTGIEFQKFDFFRHRVKVASVIMEAK